MIYLPYKLHVSEMFKTVECKRFDVFFGYTFLVYSTKENKVYTVMYELFDDIINNENGLE